MTKVEPIDGAKGAAGWRVTIKNLATDEEEDEREYAGVINCTGHHWDRRMPTYANQDKYEGQIIHSKEYKDAETQLRGRRVLVIGGGNSACDVASDAARFA